jgi:non-canonical (house-cleaning) NTP pyrophosphatase
LVSKISEMSKIVFYILNNEVKRKSGRIGEMSAGKVTAQISHAAINLCRLGVGIEDWK